MATSNVLEIESEIKRSLILQLKGNIEHISVSVFMELFGTGKPLELLKNQVDGVITDSFKDMTFLITIKPKFAHNIQSIINHINNERVNFASDNGNEMYISAYLPTPPKEIVTLHPVPAYIEYSKIKTLLERNRWGKIVEMEFGFHRNFKDIKNGWLNVYFEKLNINNIPKVIKICGKYATVTRPGESHLPLCRFCKERGHVQTRCPKKGYCTFCKCEGHILRNCRSRPTDTLQKTPQPWTIIRKTNHQIMPTPIPSTPTQNRFEILETQTNENNMNEETTTQLENLNKFPQLLKASKTTTTSTPKKQRTPRRKPIQPISNNIQQLPSGQTDTEEPQDENHSNTSITTSGKSTPSTTTTPPTDDNQNFIGDQNLYEDMELPLGYQSNIYELNRNQTFNQSQTNDTNEPPEIRRNLQSLFQIPTETTPSKDPNSSRNMSPNPLPSIYYQFILFLNKSYVFSKLNGRRGRK
ncbi:uncharacterized protein LOC144750193 [Ciona intestinalis]